MTRKERFLGPCLSAIVVMMVPILGGARGCGDDVPIGSHDGGVTPPNPDSGQAAGCYVGGCSGQLCSSDPGAVSTCEWSDSYACYQHARCERQSNGGECGWTPTAEYEACIAALDVDGGTSSGNCGGINGTPCPEGTYCSVAANGFHCNQGADLPGTCVRRPEACTAHYAPVCGCDGRTHGNSCAAASAGVDVASEGECGSSSCEAQDARGEGLCDAWFGWFWSGTQCFGVSGCGCQGADCRNGYQDREACEAAHANCRREGQSCGGFGGGSCGANEYCSATAAGGSCTWPDFGGVCVVRPEACTREYRPVCGCDGVTYSNVCVAHAAGTDVASQGACVN